MNYICTYTHPVICKLYITKEWTMLEEFKNHFGYIYDVFTNVSSIVLEKF